MKNILPIGSVVKLKQESEVMIMISGYYPITEGGELYDYFGVIYPCGILSEQSIFMLREEDIENVLFQGFQDDVGKAVISLLEEEE